MPIIYITGPTGSGKSTVCEAIREKGFEAYDTDDKGMRKIQYVDSKKLLFLDFSILRNLHNGAGDKIIFVCGTSPNDLDEINLFKKIILLNINEAQQSERILHRTNSKYGKEPHQLANAIKWRQVQIKRYQNAGAITIDANQPVTDITAQIMTIAKLT